MKYSLHIIVSRNFLFAQNGSNFIILHYRIIAGLLDLSTNLNNRSLYHSLRFDETNPEHAARTGVPKGRSGPRSGSGSPRLASRRKSRFPQLSPAVRGDPPFTRPIVRGAPTLRLWMSGTRGTQLHALRPGHVRVREVASTREKEREGGGGQKERGTEKVKPRKYARLSAILLHRVEWCFLSIPSHLMRHLLRFVMICYQSDDIARPEHRVAWCDCAAVFRGEMTLHRSNTPELDL